MALTITRNEMVTEIRTLLRDTGGSPFWSDTTVKNRINRVLVRSPYFWKEEYQSLSITNNQVEFTGITRFKKLRRAFFKDSGTPPTYIDVEEGIFEAIGSSLNNTFYHDSVMYLPQNPGANYTLEVFFQQTPDTSTADGSALDIAEDKIELLKYETAYDLSLEDTRPIMEARVWRQDIKDHLLQLRTEAGVASTVE